MPSQDEWDGMLGVGPEEQKKIGEIVKNAGGSTDEVMKQKRKDYESPGQAAEKLKTAWSNNAFKAKEFKRKKKARKQAQRSRATNRRKASGRSRATRRA